MKIYFYFAAPFAIFTFHAAHAEENLPMIANRPINTFSIVAFDAASGEMGVAVQSHWFSVGSVVTWAEAGAGVVATQSFADPAYGPRGLALMKSGIKAEAALKALLSADKSEAVRQVAFIDAEGTIAAHTGTKCIESAGHHAGEHYSVQANMMENDKVVPAMWKAFEAAKGDLAERMMLALEAAQEAGGDVRGRQSAAMLIVKIKGTGRPWADRVLELRVEDHEYPLKELRRLLTINRGYEQMNLGDAALEKQDMATALKHYSAAAAFVPGNIEILYWQAVMLATNNHLDKALPIFREVFSKDKRWMELTKRLHKPEIIPDTEEGRALVERILKEGK